MANDIITKPYLKEVLSGVKSYVDSKGAATVVVDAELSATSENAVQNKAVKAYVDNMRVKFAAALPDTGEDNLIYAVKKQSLKYIPYKVWQEGNIDFSETYGYNGSTFYTYIVDDGESFPLAVDDYLPDNLSVAFWGYASHKSGRESDTIYVLIHNAADDTYSAKELIVSPDFSKPIKDGGLAYKIRSIQEAEGGKDIKVADDVVPPYTSQNQNEYGDGFVLRKTTYVLYTYNSGKWQQLGSKFASDLMDIDSLKTELKTQLKTQLETELKTQLETQLERDLKFSELREALISNLELHLDEYSVKEYYVTASTNLTMKLDGGLYSLDVYIKNTASSEITVTIPDDYVSNTHSFKMAAGSYVALTVCYSYNFGKYIVNIGSALR